MMHRSWRESWSIWAPQSVRPKESSGDCCAIKLGTCQFCCACLCGWTRCLGTRTSQPKSAEYGKSLFLNCRCVSEFNVAVQVLEELLLKLGILNPEVNLNTRTFFWFETLPNKFPRWTWHCLFVGQTSWWHSRYAIDFTFTSSSSISCSWTFHSQHGLGGDFSVRFLLTKNTKVISPWETYETSDVLTKSIWTS